MLHEGQHLIFTKAEYKSPIDFLKAYSLSSSKLFDEQMRSAIINYLSSYGYTKEGIVSSLDTYGTACLPSNEEISFKINLNEYIDVKAWILSNLNSTPDFDKLVDNLPANWNDDYWILPNIPLVNLIASHIDPVYQGHFWNIYNIENFPDEYYNKLEAIDAVPCCSHGITFSLLTKLILK